MYPKLYRIIPEKSLGAHPFYFLKTKKLQYLFWIPNDFDFSLYWDIAIAEFNQKGLIIQAYILKKNLKSSYSDLSFYSRVFEYVNNLSSLEEINIKQLLTHQNKYVREMVAREV